MKHDLPPGRGKPMRLLALLAFALLGVLVAGLMGLMPGDLIPRESGARTAMDFFQGALRPALQHNNWVPPGAPSLFEAIAAATQRTILIAFAALGLALVFALPLAFLGAECTWKGNTSLLARSVHEYLLALLFLAAIGLSPGAGVLALALPATGILAKIFGELLDEAQTHPFRAMENLGATRATALLFGTLPRALPDLAAYTFYRLECALRGSFILGFFGFPTLGLGLRLAFEEGDYPTVWTYLYALIALMVIFELSSAAMRRRLRS